ncbi:MAG: hypothetical protein ACI8X5_003190 [Planctomycetota bacterium]|jgi:hypothetical protein
MNISSRTFYLFFLSFALTLLTSATASAQEEFVGVPDPGLKIRGIDVRNIELLLTKREREVLHPGTPLELVGIEEGSNEFRSKTPLLAGADKSSVQIDADENYKRRLAMYDRGETFDTPLPRVNPSPVFAPEGRSTSRRSNRVGPNSTVQTAEEDEFSFVFILWLSAAALAASLGWKYRYHLMF